MIKENCKQIIMNVTTLFHVEDLGPNICETLCILITQSIAIKLISQPDIILLSII